MSITNVTEIFGSFTFGDAVMKERLPQKVYKELRKTIDLGAPLNTDIADAVATALKDWAIELGATHYTHWFQPLTNTTAEKHDSFINPTGDGKVLMEFTGKELIKAEPDASSFPSGGIRQTCSARGYTAWDCTSPAFVKESPNGTRVLCIPTVFTSYTGDSLDFKTPLLRSQDAIGKQTMRVLKLFGKTPDKISSSVGAEQEYFLVDKKKFKKRKDLMLAGRTLFGAPAPKGQELDDSYFGNINEKVLTFMEDFNVELWKYGIAAKTQHNEVAPGQCEIAPIYTDTNTANDNNQLLMETAKKIADRNDLACLLYEKPFAGVNGSGKHNNWSIATSDGENLLDPGKTPEDNIQFQLFLAAILAAVDKYSELLRASASSAGNDHRLGANEAPPAIISAYLGEQLADVVEQIIEKGEATSSIKGKMYVSGASTLPQFRMDATDRNRTSPFAFTGNKFEFRMVGSTQSCAMPTMVLNTIVADTLSDFADELEKEEDFNKAVKELIRREIVAHQRIIFNGNGYSQEWVDEAAKRGLPNIPCMVEAIPFLASEKSIALFNKMSVMNETELKARAAVMFENYAKYINIEARTMIDMAKKEIMPAVIVYQGELAKDANNINALGIDPSVQKEMIQNIAVKLDEIKKAVDNLEAVLAKADEYEEDVEEWARYFRYQVFAAFDAVRKPADALEGMIAKEYWPLPTYYELLFEI